MTNLYTVFKLYQKVLDVEENKIASYFKTCLIIILFKSIKFEANIS